MRYYRIFPREDIRDMILRQVDDLVENCYVKEWGLFYYKDLPGLTRPGNNTMVLEALSIAYELTKDRTYLEYGLGTFRNAMNDKPGYSSRKRTVEDAVLVGTMSSKNFAQSMIPLAFFWHELDESGMSFL
jgi:hypothetical protein